MKKFRFALLCMASLAIVVACGEKKGQAVTGDAEVDQKVEKAEKKLSEMTGIERCDATWQKRYEGKLTLADVQPDFEFTEKEKGFDCFSGNGVNNAKAVYLKKDGSDITPDEWKAYVTKIYNVTKKLAQDGKVVRGFGTDINVKTREQALQERTLDQVLSGGENLEWAFLKNDQFEACYLNMQNLPDEKYVSVTFAEGVQKNFEEAMKDAEEFLKK